MDVFYFSNDMKLLTTRIKSVFQVSGENIIEKVVAMYALDDLNDSGEIVRVSSQECFIFFKLRNSGMINWKKYKGLAETLVTKYSTSVINEDDPIYQIYFSCTQKGRVSRCMTALMSEMNSDVNIYDIQAIPRITPKRSDKKGKKVIRDDDVILTYCDSRIYHLIKMLGMYPNVLKIGTINLDMTKPESFEHLDIILLHCITHDTQHNIKINLLNTSMMDRITICKSLHRKLAAGGMNIPYKKITERLAHLDSVEIVELDHIDYDML